MTIPDFQALMLPLLAATADGREHTLPELRARLAHQFGLTEAELSQRLPSGGQTTFDNRVGWAQTYLGKAGLLERPRRGLMRITDSGRALLAENPQRIDLKLLERYESYRQFRETKRDRRPVALEPRVAMELTPEEMMEQGYRELRTSVTEDLLTQVKSASPSFFERLVVELLLKLGYGGALGEGETLGKSGDGGVDGVIREDKLGLDVVYVQAKRWEASVGRPLVQAFVGSLEGHKARKGVMITTSTFSNDARGYVQNIEKRVVLVDGRQLAELMVDTGLGVNPVASYTIWRIDSDYFTQDQA
ncbi:MAG: restriction endonuclease [Chloroflexi bacterium CFX7]|nr:restriction endonuclease [Chloroflexi bacterium CFX7]RIL02827.1 MAG: restriction endonuclease [bacterium]